MKQFVLDCSATITYCMKDESSAYVDSVFDALTVDAIAFVPPNWFLEVVNACVSAIRRKRMNMDQAEEIYLLLKEFPVEIEYFDDMQSFWDLHTIAHTYDLTAYDAAYLHVAINNKLPLVTMDNHLKKMAKKAGVTLWTPN